MSSYLLACVQRDYKEKQVKGGGSNPPVPANPYTTREGQVIEIRTGISRYGKCWIDCVFPFSNQYQIKWDAKIRLFKACPSYYLNKPATMLGGWTA
jgi:hypothetical protein